MILALPGADSPGIQHGLRAYVTHSYSNTPSKHSEALITGQWLVPFRPDHLTFDL